MNRESLNKAMGLMGGGCLTLFLGGALMMVAIGTRGGGAGALAFIFGFAGLGLFGWGLIFALQEAMGDDRKKPEVRTPGVYVVGKLILDQKFEQVYDPEMYEPEELRLLVQVWIPGKGKEEMKTHPAVFNAIREGMTGTLVSQGKWISQFIPEKKEESAPGRPAGLPPDPFSTGQL